MENENLDQIFDKTGPDKSRMSLIMARLRVLKDVKIKETGEVDFITPFQEAIVPSNDRVFPYYLSWVLISQIMVIPLYVILKINEEEISYMGTFVLYALMMASSASLPIWASKKLENFLPNLCHMVVNETEEVFLVYREKLQKIFSTENMMLCGLITATAAVVGEYIIGLPMKSTTLKIAFLVFDFIAMLMVGAGCYVLFMVAIVVDSLSQRKDSSQVNSSTPVDSPLHKKQLQLDISIYQHPEASLLSIGRLLLQFALIAIAPYVFGFAGRYIGNWTWDCRVWIWYIFFAIGIILFFILPQIGIHRLMITKKRAEVSKLADRIKDVAEKAIEDPSQENISHLERLYALEKYVSGMKEWPFNIKALLTIITGLVLPVALMIIDHLLKRFM